MPEQKIIRNLLLVDDDPDELTIFRDATKGICKEIRVALVSLPREIDNVLSSFVPDLIFLDVNMPGMNGYDWLKMLKAKAVDTPVIMYSTSTDKERIHRAYQEGAVIYLPKPLEFGDLVLSLNKILAMDWSVPEKIRQGFFGGGNYRLFSLKGFYMPTEAVSSRV